MVILASDVPCSSPSLFGSILTIHLLHLLVTVRHSNSLTHSLSLLSRAGFTHMVLCFLFLRAFWLEDFFLSRDRHSFVSSRMAQREWGCCVLAINDYAFTNVRRAGKNCLLVRIWVQKSTVVARQGFAINQSLTSCISNPVKILWP